MRFALTACKFGGLYLSHQFCYDLVSLLEAISLNVGEKEMKKNCEKDHECLRPRVPREALRITSQTYGDTDSVKGISH